MHALCWSLKKGKLWNWSVQDGVMCVKIGYLKTNSYNGRMPGVSFEVWESVFLGFRVEVTHLFSCVNLKWYKSLAWIDCHTGANIQYGRLWVCNSTSPWAAFEQNEKSPGAIFLAPFINQLTLEFPCAGSSDWSWRLGIAAVSSFYFSRAIHLHSMYLPLVISVPCCFLKGVAYSWAE